MIKDQIQFAKDWHPAFGDRMQEIVIIGQKMNRKEIEAQFDHCLLSDEELSRGSDYWTTIEDPFPEEETSAEDGEVILHEEETRV